MVRLGGVGVIHLPGILSLGGKKYTWKRYTVKYQETISGNTTKTFPSNSIRWDYNYNISGDHFVFPNDYRSGISILKANYYFSTQFGTMTEIYKVVSVAANEDNTFTVTYKIYKLQGSADAYVDTVESKNRSDFPENGLKNGYWYVLQ